MKEISTANIEAIFILIEKYESFHKIRIFFSAENFQHERIGNNFH